MNQSDAGQQPIASMNVTPMIDVMFVLLVLFLVSIPLMVPQTLGIDLPDTQRHNDTKLENDEPVRLALRANGRIELNGETVAESDVGERLQAIGQTPDARLVLEADEAVTYGRIAELMVEAQIAGINRLGFLTESEPGR